MRPYRLRLRLSQRGLTFPRFDQAPAAAGRPAARASLGSVSSEIELMAHLLSSGRRHLPDMIAPTERLRKRRCPAPCSPPKAEAYDCWRNRPVELVARSVS